MNTYIQKFIYKLHRVKTKLFLLVKAIDKISYAQTNEDQLLDIFSGGKNKGFYVDIGANDPNNISVTKKFYERGWRGINVEPSKRMYDKLCQFRPEDINLNNAVGAGGVVDFYEPNKEEGIVGSTLNSSLPEKDGWDMADMTVSKIQTITLKDVLQKANQPIDFMSIDVESYEWEVLKSHDWKIKPQVMCIEGKGYDEYLSKFGYKKMFYDGGNSYFKLVE